jgi:predicted RecA/RadA family phage recombinase
MAYKGQPVPSTTYQKGYFKVSDGKSVEVSVPADSDLKAGQFAYLDGFLGVITRDVKTAANETAKAILIIEVAEYETDQIDDSKTFAKGDKVYWDNTNKRFTTDTTGIFAGVVTNAKDSNGVIWFVLWPGFVNETALQAIGDLNDLNTTDHQTLVDAINEVVASVDDAQADATEALERIAENVTCADNADTDAVRTALIELLEALEDAGLMDSGE